MALLHIAWLTSFTDSHYCARLHQAAAGSSGSSSGGASTHFPSFPSWAVPRVAASLQAFPASSIAEAVATVYPVLRPDWQGSASFATETLKAVRSVAARVLSSSATTSTTGGAAATAGASSYVADVQYSGSDRVTTAQTSTAGAQSHDSTCELVFRPTTPAAVAVADTKLALAVRPAVPALPQEPYSSMPELEHTAAAVLQSLAQRRPVCLLGDRGGGKSAMVRHLAARCGGQSVATLVLYRDMTARDLLARRVVGADGATQWVQSPLTQAAVRGRCVVLLSC
jgi:AAA domain (dynein-related subfamily)